MQWRHILQFLGRVIHDTPKGCLVAGLLAMLGAQGLVVAQPLILGKLISNYARAVSDGTTPLPGLSVLGWFVAMWFGASALEVSSGLCSAVVLQDLRVAGKKRAFSMLLQKDDHAFFASAAAGDLETRISTVSMCCRGIYHELATSLLKFLALTLFASIALARFDWRLSALFLCWLLAFIGAAANPRFNRAPALAGEAVGATSAVTGLIVDVLAHIDLVRTAGEQEGEQRRLGTLLAKERRLYLRGQFEVERAMLVKRTLLFLLVAGIAGIIAIDARTGAATATDVATVMMIALMLAYNFEVTGLSIVSLQEYVYRLDQSLTGLGIEDAIFRGHGATKNLVPGQSPSILPIECIDVAFAHRGQPALFRNLNLRIAAGDRIGIIGPSGSGKSTLLHLLRGELRPTRGAIVTDGRELDPERRDELRGLIAYVSQDTPLLNRSLRENLVYGVHRPVDDEVLTGLLERLGLDRLRGSSRVDLELPVGEHGAKLSGGERQRIGLIRAWLREVPLILLDEPTSALDPANEQLVAKFIESLAPDRSALVVSHRRDLLRGIDRIYSLENGAFSIQRGAESSTHH